VHAALSLLTLAPGKMGGSENVLMGLLGEYRRGHGPARVTAIANARAAARYGDLVDVRTVRWYPAPEAGAGRALALVAGLAAPPFGVPDDADVVHYPFTVPIPRTKLPTVVTLHDVQHRDMPAFFSRAERAYRSVAYDRAALNATLVITPSEFSRGRIADVLGVDAGRVVAIPHGLDHERFRPDGPRADDMPERFLYYPANLWPHKNHERLLEAFSRVDTDAHLILSGADYGRTLELPERVRHVGYVQPDRLPALYRSAAGVIYPSLYEGAGVPPLEAMACACPVAASRIPPIEEYCGDSVLYLEPEDVGSIARAIEGLLAGEAPDGRERAERYTWRAAAERHAEAYERATRLPRRAARAAS
jgi:glycosyltransferase involved in cell wall biosynthesis